MIYCLLLSQKTSVKELGIGNKRRGLNRDFPRTPCFDACFCRFVFAFERKNESNIAIPDCNNIKCRNN